VERHILYNRNVYKVAVSETGKVSVSVLFVTVNHRVLQLIISVSSGIQDSIHYDVLTFEENEELCTLTEYVL
jgi:hypothetical protein